MNRDIMKAKIEAGIAMMKWLKEGTSMEQMWLKMGDMGLSPEHRVDVAKTVHAFMSHRNGDHSQCPHNCGETEFMARNHVSTTKANDINGMIDEAIDINDLHQQKKYNDDTLEEWK